MVFGFVSNLMGNDQQRRPGTWGAQRTLTAPEPPGLYPVTATVPRRLATC